MNGIVSKLVYKFSKHPVRRKQTNHIADRTQKSRPPELCRANHSGERSATVFLNQS